MANEGNADIATWLRENPHRINLGTIGLSFGNETVTESMLEDTHQELDLWNGVITSAFTYQGSSVEVQTRVDPESDTVAISVKSELLASRGLGIFFDFPYPVNGKFNAPFVGAYNETEKHTTSLTTCGSKATIHHDLDTFEYDFTVEWAGKGKIVRPSDRSHRYTLMFEDADHVQLIANWSPQRHAHLATYDSIHSSSKSWWNSYWKKSAFVDLTQSGKEEATELQRRTILSQYLLAVNSASNLPPQESGLVNNGWYGKFHVRLPLVPSMKPG